MAHEAPARRPATRATHHVRQWWMHWALGAFVSAIAIYTLSPRFSLDTPSMIDDWSAIANADEQLGAVARGDNPEEGRFRPGWILWNFLQWHTFDAPGGMAGPNVWNVLRAVVLVAGITLFTTLAIGATTRARWRAVDAGLAVLPALLLVTIPVFSVDLARFGPQEPALVGCMALGGSLLWLATRSIAADRGSIPIAEIWLLGLTGGALWLVGVYQKEAAFAVVPIVLAVAIRERTPLEWSQLSGTRRAVLAAIGVAVVVPLVHVAVEITRIAARGDLVYDTKIEGGRGVAHGLAELVSRIGDIPLTEQLRYVIVPAVVLTLLALAVERAVDWLAVSVLAAGLGTFVFAAQAGVAVSRYYFPLFALFAVAISLALARFPAPARLAGVLLFGGIALTFVPDAHADVERWVSQEEERAALIEAVVEFDATGCDVAVDGLEAEFTKALPVLVALERTRLGDCADGETYLVVGSDESPLPHVCATDALEPLGAGPIARTLRCERLATRPVRDPGLGRLSPRALVARRLLRVGQRSSRALSSTRSGVNAAMPSTVAMTTRSLFVDRKYDRS